MAIRYLMIFADPTKKPKKILSEELRERNWSVGASPLEKPNNL